MMNTPARSYWSLPRRLLQQLSSVILLVALFAPEAQAAVSATSTSSYISSPVFYTDSKAGTAATTPVCNYLSFNMTNNGSYIADAWVELGSFTGGLLSTAPYDDGLFHIGPMAGGEVKPAFFYVCSSYTGRDVSVTTQGYTVTTYSGKPVFGSSLGGTTFTTTIDDGVIEAQANKVVAVWSGTTNDVLGATATLTVDGDTGVIGCADPSCTSPPYGPLVFSPATATGWRADAYELVKSEIVFSGNVNNAGTYTNTLYVNDMPTSANTHYTATYYFRPVSTTVSGVPLSPVSHIASGGPMKHTALFSEVGSNFPAANVLVLAKSVSHATLPAQGGVVTYTLSATNNGSLEVSLDSFIDVLPAGAVYVPGSTTFNNVSYPNPYEYPDGVTLEWSSYFNIPAGATRNLIFQATLPATPATYTNAATALVASVVIDATQGSGDNVPATASTVVLFAPTITKAFSPTALAIGISSTLTLTISNPNAAHTLNGIAISDTLPASPAGLVFATPPNAATTCTGAALNISGTTISITGGTLTVGQSCTVSVKVTSSANNSYTNTTGVVSSSNGGAGTTASATIDFTPKPTISKAFSVSSIPVNGTATMSFVITNNTAGAITGMTFDDLFPVGLVTANPASLSSTCGGSVDAWDGATSSALNAAGGDVGIQLSDGVIVAVGGTCAISVAVTSAVAGVYDNTTSGVVSDQSTIGPVSNTATLSVLAPPTVSKAFSPSTIGKGQSSTLTITLTNPNATAISGAAFIDTYPTNLLTAGTPNAVTSCTSGSVSSTAGSVSLSAATIPASGSCTVSIDVTSNVVNLIGYTNTLAIGAVTTSNTGSNTVAASATLIVNATPTINKSFSFNLATGIATMGITITNNAATAITGLSFTDLFPSGMNTDNPPTLTPATPCGTGSSIQSWNGTTAGTLSTTGGDLGIKLTAGQIAGSGSCTFSLRLKVNSLGVYNNQTTGLTSSSYAGSGSVSNTATWIAPAVGKIFTPTQVTPTTLGPSDISRLIITITNPSLTTTLTGLAITDIYPTTATKLAGGSLAAAITSPVPNESNSCGGTLTATSTGMTLSGGALLPGASCSIAADVLATNDIPALYANTTGKVISEQGIGTTASNSLIITTKPTIEKSFLVSPESLTNVIASGTVMRIVVENNSGGNITGVSFSDTFPTSPSQMVWVSTDADSCNGTLTVAAGGTGFNYTGGSILSAAPANCTIDITVSVSAAGSYFNTTSGAISSANSEVGPVSNTAELVVHLDPPTAIKAFANTGFQVGNANKLTITLTNPNTQAITSMAFTDTYPANLVNAAAPDIFYECGGVPGTGTATAAAGVGSLSITGATIPASGSCVIEVNLTATAAGVYTNTLAAGAVTSANANAGPAADVTDTATAYLPPTLSKSFGVATLGAGSTTTLVLTLTNPASNSDVITDVQVDDTFPTGMTLQNVIFGFTPAACGTVTRTNDTASVAGDGAIRFKVLSLAAGISCQVSVNITSSTSGAVTNTTNAPIATAATAMAALTGTTAWDSITVLSAPSIMLLKSVQTISDPVNLGANPKAIPGAVVQYSIISTNSGAGSADIDSTVLIDPIPANTLLYVNDIGGIGSGPIIFSQGTTSSTLIYTFNALNDAGDDLSFSNDGGTLYTTTPTFDALTGCDTTVPSITHVRVNPKGTFVGNAVPPSPSFNISFRVCVQ